MKYFILLLFSTVSFAATFTEISSDLGIDFKHNDGRTGKFHMTETSGSGIGWIDFNNDDKLDLIVINGTDGKHKLFKNTGTKFIDVSNTTIPNHSKARGMGICSADINQDGWVDFLITNYGADILYINQAGKKFKPIKLDKDLDKDLDKHADTQQWSSSCAFADLDNDGDIDLYVARYAVFNLNGNKSCQSADAKGYCNPTAYKGEKDGLYINNGKGEFTLASSERGIHNSSQDRGFGVVISDFDQDNDMDIYVANDGSSNRLYINNGTGFFKDQGLLSGTAINQNGAAEASMGVSIGDINSDGLQDIVVSHFSMETNTVYQNFGNLMFSDSTQAIGINRDSYMSMGWGISFTDVDNDGKQDLIVANGHIHDFINKLDSRQSYKQVNQIFMNKPDKKYVLQSHEQSFIGSNKKSSRGMAVADFNNDGKIDLAINNIDDEIDVFKNTDTNKNNWLGIKLNGSAQNSSAIGTVVMVKIGGHLQRKEVMSGGSFMSQSDFRLIFGLGSNTNPVELLITWPDGKKSKHVIKKLNQYHTINYL